MDDMVSNIINAYNDYKIGILLLQNMGIKNPQEKIYKYITTTKMTFNQAYYFCIFDRMNRIKEKYEIESLKEI